MNIKFENMITFKDIEVGKVFQCKTGDYFLKISKKIDYNAAKLTSSDNEEEDELLYSIGKDTPCRLVDAQFVIF